MYTYNGHMSFEEEKGTFRSVFPPGDWITALNFKSVGPVEQMVDRVRFPSAFFYSHHSVMKRGRG